MDEFDWDELQVIKDPDAKQVEVSFIKDDEGGTIGSDFPCVRILAPDDYFPYKDNSGHYYIAYVTNPLPYAVTGTVTHTTGGICEPNSILVPQEMEASSTFTIPRGETEVRVDLNLGTVLVDVSQTPDYKAAYTATLTSVTEGAVCGEPACIKFWAGTDIIPPEPDPEPEPDTEVPPDDDQFPECLPHDCDAYTLHIEPGTLFGTAGEIDSMYNNSDPKEFANLRHVLKQASNDVPTNTGGLSGTFINWPGTASAGSTPCNPASFYFLASSGVANSRITPIPYPSPVYYSATPGLSYEDRPLWIPFGIDIDVDFLVLLVGDTGSFSLLEYQMLSVNTANIGSGPYRNLSFTWDKNSGPTGTMSVLFNNSVIYNTAINATDNDIIRFRFAAVITQYPGTYLQDTISGPVTSGAIFEDLKISLGGDLGTVIELAGGPFNANQQSTLPHKAPDEGNGIYPNVLQNAPLLAVFEAGNPATEAANRKKVADIRRSFQEYTPPTYCERIP